MIIYFGIGIMIGLVLFMILVWDEEIVDGKSGDGIEVMTLSLALGLMWGALLPIGIIVGVMYLLSEILMAMVKSIKRIATEEKKEPEDELEKAVKKNL
jgi:hypothetical protein